MNRVHYLTGAHYDDLCKSCKNSINDAHILIVDGFANEEYVIDPEGPSMLAYDKGWLCNDDCII